MTKGILKCATLILMAMTIASCTTQKKLTYFQGITKTCTDSINRHFKSEIEPIIKMGDALTITVNALDQEAAAPYNLPTVNMAKPNNNVVSSNTSQQYYLVDAEGNINFPVLGSLHVLGLKRTEVENMIAEKLAGQIIDPLVVVHLLNAHVTVMGEVVHPGQIAMSNERLSLPDALAAAGDLTPYGKRDNIMIAREVNGKMEFARISLNGADIFTSPYYYLQQNDIIYVSPNNVRAVSSQNIGLWLSMVSTVASAATVIVTVVNASKKD
ncbi:MAG: polysaccharide biosynthesis/export family protein [Paludibacteraceae bacterium]|nr:polysaccharide biosynthesis/export family protein [Paludibacteraceae bacterium]